MKDNDLLKGLEFIDAELIEAADRIPEKRNKVVAIGWHVATLGMAALIAIVMTIAYKWGATGSGDIHIYNPEQPTVQQTVYPTAPTNIPTEPTQQTQPKGPITMDAAAYLTLDVNPSVQFSIESGLVKDCVALNDDGEYIWADLRLVGMTIEEALPLVTDEMIEQGYMAKADHAPVMLLSAKGGAESGELLYTAITTAREELIKKEVETFIVTQQIEDAETERLAKLYGVSVGKMQYVLDILEKESGLSLEEASTKSIVELFSLDIEKRLIEPPYKVGDYDEYGEKITFVGTVESYVGYVPWDELSEEYKNTLREMYTPEALEILAKPRIWTTMPNVVGLSVDEALALLYSRNIAPKIHYEDNADARRAGYSDGTCFHQDIPQGWRWNSDASIQISILISENQEGKSPFR